MSRIVRNIYNGPKRCRIGTIAAQIRSNSYRSTGCVEEYQIFDLRRGQTDAICYEMVSCEIKPGLDIAVWDPKAIDSGDPYIPDDYYFDPSNIAQKYCSYVIPVKRLFFSVNPEGYLGEDKTCLTLPGIIID